MKLENGYKIMYSAYERVSEQKPGPLYASKELPSVNDAMLISYNDAGQYIDCKQFKLIYDDGEHLLGSYSGIPGEEDVNIIIKAGNEIVFGKVKEQPVMAKVEAPKKKVVIEEPKHEEPEEDILEVEE